MEEIKVALNGLAIVVVTGLIGVVANYAKLALKKISDKANAELVKIENENTRNLIQNAKDDLVDLPPRFARCSTPHRHGLKSASVHRFLKSVKSMMPSPRVNLVKC